MLGSQIYPQSFLTTARPASVHDWSRRFWQGSHDHRGTEKNPDRVVTLVKDADAVCGGRAFLVEGPVFEQLDIIARRFLCTGY